MRKTKTKKKQEIYHMDIGDICLYCEEHNCMACREGNPCLGFSDYDRDNDTCISNGGCGKQTKE